MVELIVMNATQRIDQATQSHPTTFMKNRDQWLHLLLKSPKMQKFYDQFNHDIANIMQAEMIHNKQNFDLFMTHPRSPKGNICNLYSSQGFQSKEDINREKIMVANGLDSAKRKYNYKKQKQEMINQMRYGRNFKDKKNENEGKEVEKSSIMVSKIQSKKNGITDKNQKDSQKTIDQKNINVVKYYSDFQIRLKGATKSIDDLISSIDDENREFKKEIDETYDELEEIAQIKRENMYPVIPGQEVEKILQEWDEKNDRREQTEEDMIRYSNELWISLRQYEIQIRKQIKGHDLELAYQMKRARCKVKAIHEKAMFQIEVYEGVFHELKLNHYKELEQEQMQKAELESMFMNLIIPERHVFKIIKECESGLILRNTTQAREIINRLVNVNKSQMQQIRLLTKSQTINQTDINLKNENIEFEKHKTQANQKLRFQYQQMLLKLIRDVDMFKDQPEILEKFKKINEFSDEIADQQFYIKLLEEIDLKKQINDFANQHLGTKENIVKLKAHIENMGIQEDLKADKIGVKSRNPVDKKRKNSSKSFEKNELTKTNTQIINIEKVMKNGLIRLLNNSITGFLEKPIATIDSGNPDYDKVEYVDPDAYKQKLIQFQKEQALQQLKTSKIQKKTPIDRSYSTNQVNYQGINKKKPSNKSQSLFVKKNNLKKKHKGHSANPINLKKLNISGKQTQIISSEIVSQSVSESIEQTPSSESEKDSVLDFDYSRAVTEESLILQSSVEDEKISEKIDQVELLKSSSQKSKTLNQQNNCSKIDFKGSKVSSSDSNKNSSADLKARKKPKKKVSSFFKLQSLGIKQMGDQQEEASDAISGSQEQNYPAAEKRPPLVRLNSGPLIANIDAASSKFKVFRDKLDSPQQIDFDLLLQVCELKYLIESPEKQAQNPNIDGKLKDSNKNSIGNGRERKINSARKLKKISQTFELAYNSNKLREQGHKAEKPKSKSQNSDALSSLGRSHSVASVSIESREGGQSSKQIQMRALEASRHFIEPGLELPNTKGLGSKTLSKIKKYKREKGLLISTASKATFGKNAALQSYSPVPSLLGEVRTPECSYPQEPLNALLLIDQTLNELTKDKFKYVKKDTDMRELESDKAFKLNAKSIQGLSESIQTAMNEIISFNNNQRIIEEPYVQKLFEVFNELQAKKFKFEETNTFIENGGHEQLNDTIVALPDVLGVESKDNKDKVKYKNNKLIINDSKKPIRPKINLCDIIKPCISESGEFLGVQIKNDLAKPVYFQNNNDQAVLIKILKVSSYINRMMQDGIKDEFALTQIVGSKVLKICKQSRDMSTQIEEMYLEKEKEPDDAILETNALIHKQFKQHLIDMLIRCDYKKRNYQNMMFEQYKIDQLYSYVLPKVYLDKSHAENGGHGTYFGQYIQALFSLIKKKMDSARFMGNQKEQLNLEIFMLHGLDQAGAAQDRFGTEDQACQAVVPMRDSDAQTHLRVDMNQNPTKTTAEYIIQPEQLYLTEQKMNKKNAPKHQIILDKALEGQFDLTLDLFDSFVNKLTTIDARKFRELDYQLQATGKDKELIESDERKQRAQAEDSFGDALTIKANSSYQENKQDQTKSTQRNSEIKKNSSKRKQRANLKKSVNRGLEPKLRPNQKSQVAQVNDDNNDKFEGKVSAIRAKLSGKIQEIKTDPLLVNKYMQNFHELISSDPLYNNIQVRKEILEPNSDIQVGQSQLFIQKLQKNQINLQIDGINKTADLDRDLHTIDIVQDSTNWDNAPQSNHLLIPQSTPFYSSKNTVYSQDYVNSRNMLPFIKTEKHEFRSFGSSFDKNDPSSGQIKTEPSQLNTLSGNHTPNQIIEKFEINKHKLSLPAPYAFEQSFENIPENLNRTPKMIKQLKSKQIQKFPKAMRVLDSNMNQTHATVFHPRQKVLADIKTQEKKAAASKAYRGSSLNQSMQISSGQTDFTARRETLAEFAGRIDLGQVDVPHDIVSKVNKGKNFEWYNRQLEQRWKTINKEKPNDGSVQVIKRVQEAQRYQGIINEFHSKNNGPGYHAKSLNQSPDGGYNGKILTYIKQSKLKKIKKNNQKSLGNKGEISIDKLCQGSQTQVVSLNNSPLRVSKLANPNSLESKIFNNQEKAKITVGNYTKFRTQGSAEAFSDYDPNLKEESSTIMGLNDKDLIKKSATNEFKYRRTMYQITKQDSTKTDIDKNLRNQFEKKQI